MSNASACVAGPMVEPDGTERLPDYFAPYVSFVLLTAVLTPAAALGVLVWQGEADLGISTVGLYLLCLIMQIAIESITLRQGKFQLCRIPCI